MQRFVAAVLVLGLFGAPCALGQNHPPALADLIARTKAQIRVIGLPALKAAFDAGSTGLLIDVREPDEFRSGHLPGAINIPRGQIELSIWSRVGAPGEPDMGRKMTLYCGSGVRCMLAAKSLQDLGFTNVVAVDMRLGDWAKAGYPLVAD